MSNSPDYRRADVLPGIPATLYGHSRHSPGGGIVAQDMRRQVYADTAGVDHRAMEKES